MSSPGNGGSVELNLGIQQALQAMKTVSDQAKRLQDTLSKSLKMGDDAFVTQMKLVRVALKDQATALQAFGSTLSSFDQKIATTTQRVNANTERFASSIGQSARILDRATKLVNDAVKTGAVGPNTLAERFKTAAAAQEAIVAGMRRIQTELAKVDAAGQGYSGAGARSLLVEREVRAVAALQVRYQELAAAEKSGAAATAERLNLEIAGEQRILAMNAEQFSQQIAGERRVQAMTEERISQELAGEQRVRAMNAEQFDQYLAGLARIHGANTERFNQEAAGLQRIRAMNAENFNLYLSGLQRTFRMEQEQLRAKQASEREANAPYRLFQSQAARFVNYALLGSAIGGAYGVVSQVVKLDEALHNLQAITTTSDAGMATLRQRILDVSSASKFMATDVANAATILGQAGLSAQQIGEALSHVVTFAQASGATLDQSVQIMTSAMGAFGLRATELGNVSDTFTAALNTSKLNIDQLTTAFQYSGPAAAELGVNYKELTAVMALMANAGIKSGSIIGTGIRQILNQLAAPNTKLQNVLASLNLTMDEVDVKSLGLLGVVQKLSAAGFGATEAFQAFGTRGAGAWIALSNQVGDANSVLKGLYATGAAAKAAETQMQSLANTARETGTKIVALASDAFQPLVTGSTTAVSWIGKLVEVLHVLAPLTSIVTTGLVVFGATAGLQYIARMQLMTRATVAFGEALAAVRAGSLAGFLAALGPWGIAAVTITAAITALGVANEDLSGKIAEAAAATETANGKFQAAKDTVSAVEQEIQNLTEHHKQLADGSVALANQSAYLGERFHDLGLDVSNLTTNYNALFNAMNRIRGVAIAQMARAAGDANAAAQNELNISRQNLNQYIGPALQSAIKSAVYGSGAGSLSQLSGFKEYYSAISALSGGVGGSFASKTGINNAAINSFLASAEKGKVSMDQLVKANEALNLITDNTTPAYGRLRTLLNQMSDSYAKHKKVSDEAYQAELKVRGVAAIRDPVFQAQVTKINNQLNSLDQTKPVQGFGSSIDYAAKYNDFANKKLGFIDSEIKSLQEQSKLNPSIAYAYKLEIAALQQKRGSVMAAAQKAQDSAKAATSVRATNEETVIKKNIQVLQMKESASTSESQARGYAAQIDSAVDELFKRHLTTIFAKEGLKSSQYSISGRTYTLAKNITQDAHERIESAVNAELASLEVYTTRAGTKADKIGASVDRRASAAAKREAAAAARAERIADQVDSNEISQTARNAIKVLDLSIATHLKNIEAIKDTITEYTPLPVVKDRYAQIIRELEAWHKDQLDRLLTQQQATLEHDKVYPEGTPGYIKPKTDEEMQSAKDDYLQQFQDRVVGAGKDFATAVKSTNRLPTNYADVYRNLAQALADPRQIQAGKDWDRVDQTALLFQDIMTGIITDFRTSFADLLLSLEEGTKSIGDSLKDFGKSTLEAALKAINTNLTQKTLNFAAEHLLPDGFGDIFADPQQAQTLATKDNTVATNNLTQAILTKGFGGGSGGIPLPGGGDGTSSGVEDVQVTGTRVAEDISGPSSTSMFSSFFSQIGSFFSTLFSQLMSFIGPLMSQIGSSIGTIFTSILSALNQGGLVRRATGGLIPGKITTRDSVVAPLQVGSFVMRKTATDNIGIHTLQAMNAMAAKGKVRMAALTPGEFALTPDAVHMFGLKNLSRWNFDGKINHLALGGLHAKDMVPVDGHAEKIMQQHTDLNGRLNKPHSKPAVTNVYVVKPDEQPQLTKRDVIVTLTEDVLANGQTKKLIKSVVAGF